jgi:hypothetical protein
MRPLAHADGHGQSGNPRGRKVGSRPRALTLLDKIGQDAAADVVRA